MFMDRNQVMLRPWTIKQPSTYHHSMSDTKIVISLSVVATVLVLGTGICIAINPLSAIGLAPVLTAISLIIRAIGDAPADGSFKSIEATRADPPADVRFRVMPEHEVSRVCPPISDTVWEACRQERGSQKLSAEPTGGID
jgi:hypothetical protein